MPPKGWKKGITPSIRIVKICPNCKKEFKIYPSIQNKTFCSRKCRTEATTLWDKEGRYHSTGGYIMIPKPGISKPGKLKDLMYEHRAVAENILKRKLDRTEEVHHINGNKQDNRPENLMIIDSISHKSSRSDHFKCICEKCGHINIYIPLEGILLSTIK